MLLVLKDIWAPFFFLKKRGTKNRVAHNSLEQKETSRAIGMLSTASFCSGGQMVVAKHYDFREGS